MKQKKLGFTLLELLLVIAILGSLAALISGNFLTSLSKGRDAARKSDLSQIQRGLELYYEDAKEYPTTITFGSALSNMNEDNVVQTYMQKIPNDPKSGVNYEYISDGTQYQLYACLENSQQILPVVSTDYTMTCGVNCKDTSGNSVACVYGVSSSNVTP